MRHLRSCYVGQYSCTVCQVCIKVSIGLQKRQICCWSDAESCGDNLQVVLAVDDSRSMQENGCGVFALEAVTLLTRALTRLEVGQVGVLRFGGTDHVRPLHDLDTPFSDAAGPNIISNLRFDQVGSLCHYKSGLPQTQE